MPEVLFSVQLPDGKTKKCYSPSSVIRRHFRAGEEISLAELLTRSRAGLSEASERERAKFGMACGAAPGS